MPSNTALSTLEKQGRQIADQIIQGLKVAPAIRPGTPCVNILPILMHRFRLISLRIEGQNSKHSISVVRSHYGDLLDAFAMFANSIWTVDKKLTFESCKCHRGGLGRESVVHETEADRPEAGEKESQDEEYSSLRFIIEEIFEALSSASNDMLVTKNDALKLEKKHGQRGRWPSSPSQFIPQGASIAVSAFLKWAELAEAPIPIYVLCQATSWCPSLVSAMIQNKELLPTVQRLFHRFTNRLCHLSLLPASSPRLSGMSADMGRFVYILDSDRQWIQALYDQSEEDHVTARSQDITQLFVSIHQDFYKVISHLDEAGPSLDGKFREQLMRISALAANLMRGSLPLPVADTLSVHKLMEDVQGLTREYTSNPEDLFFVGLAFAVFSMRNQRQCVEITCDETGEDTQTNLKLCSGCQAVRYCSKECQRSDWKYHKHVCKCLKMLVPVVVAYYEHFNVDLKERVRIFANALEQAGLGKEGISAARTYLIRAGFWDSDDSSSDDE